MRVKKEGSAVRKKKKTYDDDDGRTIANMNVEGMPWYRPDAGKEVKEEDKPTRKEKRAMIWAAYLAYLPRLLAILAGFGLCALFIYLWLNGWSF